MTDLSVPMDVIINGKVEKRPVSHIERFGERPARSRYVPELREGEQCVWTIGSLTPHIVRTRP